MQAAIYQRNRARNKLNKNRTPENIENYPKLPLSKSPTGHPVGYANRIVL